MKELNLVGLRGVRRWENQAPRHRDPGQQPVDPGT